MALLIGTDHMYAVELPFLSLQLFGQFMFRCVLHTRKLVLSELHSLSAEYDPISGENHQEKKAFKVLSRSFCTEAVLAELIQL